MDENMLREGDPDLGVGLAHRLFRRRDVRPALEERRRQAHGNQRNARRQAAVRNRKSGWRSAHQHGDRLFALSARHAGGYVLRLSVEHLRLRGDDVGLGGRAGGVLVLRESERL